MTIPSPLDTLRGGIVVSCQAHDDNPLRDPAMMAAMAQAAVMGGAVGIRADAPDDVRAIMTAVSAPVLALYKVDYPDSPVRITPTVRDSQTIVATGAPLIALDATNRPRPGGDSLAACVAAIHDAGALACGDLATPNDLAGAEAAGIDLVGTTLAGYTAERPSTGAEPDFAFLEWLLAHATVPVFAEGRYWTPEQARRALDLGAAFVVVGTAITNPWKITERFVAATASTDAHSR